MDIFEKYLGSVPSFSYQRIDGSTTGDNRQQAIDEFNRDGSPDNIFMASTLTGGAGINLQTADTVVIFESDWNPSTDLQAEDRVHVSLL